MKTTLIATTIALSFLLPSVAIAQEDTNFIVLPNGQTVNLKFAPMERPSVTPSTSTTPVLPALATEIVQVSLTENSAGSIAMGQVFNRGADLQDVKVNCDFFDRSAHLVDTGFACARPDYLKRGETGSFKIYASDNGAAQTVKCGAIGSRAH